MTYPYAVKFNGKWYRPNEDVPDTAKPVVETAKAVEESAIQPVISQVKEVQPESADVSEKAVEDEPKRRGRRRKDY